MRMEDKKKRLPYLEQFRHLKEYSQLAGIKAKPSQIFTAVSIVTSLIVIAGIIYSIYVAWQYEHAFGLIILVSFLWLTFGYVLVFLLVWLLLLVVIDYFKFKRKTALEEVLPEFLRLVSANHRAGLPLDMSLWKANKPRFGILSDEINEVAKNTYASGDLIMPLQNFANKYDSNMLKRVISNMVEGLKTGADIANLLDDISTNITTIKNTRKELASEVENYMLFITITVLIISPLMFGLTHKMSGLIESVRNTLAGTTLGEGVGPASSIPINLSVEKAERPFEFYFDLFVYLMIATNSIVSVLLMSMVKYGNVKQDLKKIPVFYVVGILVYTICKIVFRNFLSI